MNVKLKALVAALALSAVATSANAAISSNNGNSELVFSAWDANAGVGYTYDLNWDKFLNDLVGADQAANAAGNALLAANAFVQSSLIGSNGVIFDGALTGLPFTGDVSGVQWSLGAYDTAGRNRLLTTQGDAGLPFASTNNQVKAAATAFGLYTPAANGFIVTPADDTYAVTSNTNGIAYPGTLSNTWNNNTVDTTNVLGGTSSLYLLAQTTQASSAAPSFAQQLLAFDGREIIAKTYLDGGVWHLQVSALTAVTAPVPEPESYAMMLAGLALMGAVARRRTKSAK